LVSHKYLTEKHLSDFGVSLFDIKRLQYASLPQTLRKDNLEYFVVHITYDILSTDIVGTLFSINAAVSMHNPKRIAGDQFDSSLI
jgi:hypothetical protein